MSLDFLTAATSDFEVAGKVLKVNSLKLREVGQLQRWLRDNTPRPTQRLKGFLDLLSPEERKEELKNLRNEEILWEPPDVWSEAANQLLFGTEEGQRCFLKVLLSRHQELTDADIEEIRGNLKTEDLHVLVFLARGEDGSDPKEAREIVQKVFSLFGVEDRNETVSTGEESSTA